MFYTLSSNFSDLSIVAERSVLKYPAVIVHFSLSSYNSVSTHKYFLITSKEYSCSLSVNVFLVEIFYHYVESLYITIKTLAFSSILFHIIIIMLAVVVVLSLFSINK